MQYRVIKQHQSEYPDPIIFSKGDRLIIGEKSEEHDDWNDWYFCTAPNQKAGWVPKQVIQWMDDGNTGKALEDYSAKEMNVKEGDLLIGIKVLNGWLWCQNPLGDEEGWVPMENLCAQCKCKCKS